MQTRNGIIEAIGNTPLIKLERVSQATGCTILGKAEFMNPGQSVKDRAALFIIEDAIKRGELRPGVVVEGTAGNTGIGLALVGNAMGFHSVIVIPETQSQEKKDALRLLEAEVIEVPAVPYKNPNNYVKFSGRLAEQMAQTSHQDRYLNKFALRTLNAEQCAEFYQYVLDLKPVNKSASAPGYHLTDGRVTLSILPWSIRIFADMSIKRPGPDHHTFVQHFAAGPLPIEICRYPPEGNWILLPRIGPLGPRRPKSGRRCGAPTSDMP